MCPNHTPDEWKYMQKNEPADFQRAMDFEREIQVKDDELWLHQLGVPLLEATERTLTDWEKWDTERCDSGYCFV